MDQAESLRDLIRTTTSHTRCEPKQAIGIYTVLSGKGGVGKTNIAVNLAIALQRRGKRVLVIDADMGMANVDVILGIYPKYTIYDVLFHNHPLQDTVITGYDGIKILPGGSGMADLALLDRAQQEAFAKQFSTLADIDVILIDTGAGINRNSLSFAAFSQDLILITTPEPTALTDAYGTIKILVQYKLNRNIKVIVNRCPNSIVGSSVYEKLNHTSMTFLNKHLEKLGHILDDAKVVQAVMNQIPFLVQYPNCTASRCVNRIADELVGRDGSNSRTYSIQQVYKRLMKVFS